MTYRVAVASSDGRFINQHFGRAGQFLIFDISGGDKFDSKFVALRNNLPPCSARQHDEARLAAAVALLSDCQAVLAAKIGPGATAALTAQGIAALEATAFIDEALVRVGKRLHSILPHQAGR